MGRYIVPEAPAGELDAYRAARAYHGVAMRLAVPATDDPAWVRRCEDALKRGHRDAAKADNWPGRVEAMAAAAATVMCDEHVALIVRHYATEEVVGDADRRAAYVRAAERAFEGPRR